MTVRIYTDQPGLIVVENKLQKKKIQSVDSTGIGLTNIKEKIQTLNRDDVMIQEGPELFKVCLPLIG